MERRCQFYEVRSTNDVYGLQITNDATEEEALAEINKSYEYAKGRGYDNRNDKWLIVCNQTVKTFDKNGSFLKEEKVRFVVGQVEYSYYENKFVFVY